MRRRSHHDPRRLLTVGLFLPGGEGRADAVRPEVPGEQPLGHRGRSHTGTACTAPLEVVCRGLVRFVLRPFLGLRVCSHVGSKRLAPVVGILIRKEAMCRAGHWKSTDPQTVTCFASLDSLESFVHKLTSFSPFASGILDSLGSRRLMWAIRPHRSGQRTERRGEQAATDPY